MEDAPSSRTPSRGEPIAEDDRADRPLEPPIRGRCRRKPRSRPGPGEPLPPHLAAEVAAPGEPRRRGRRRSPRSAEALPPRPAAEAAGRVARRESTTPRPPPTEVAAVEGSTAEIEAEVAEAARRAESRRSPTPSTPSRRPSDVARVDGVAARPRPPRWHAIDARRPGGGGAGRSPTSPVVAERTPAAETGGGPDAETESTIEQAEASRRSSRPRPSVETESRSWRR